MGTSDLLFAVLFLNGAIGYTWFGFEEKPAVELLLRY